MQQDTLTVNTEPVVVDTVQTTVQTTTSVAARPDTAVRQPARATALPSDTAFLRKDTVSIAEEPAADTTVVVPDSLPLLYLGDEHVDSLLAADSMLFRGNTGYGGRGTGMHAQPLPPVLFRNDGVSIALTTLLVEVAVVARGGQTA